MTKEELNNAIIDDFSINELRSSAISAVASVLNVETEEHDNDDQRVVKILVSHPKVAMLKNWSNRLTLEVVNSLDFLNTSRFSVSSLKAQLVHFSLFLAASSCAPVYLLNFSCLFKNL